MGFFFNEGDRVQNRLLYHVYYKLTTFISSMFRFLLVFMMSPLTSELGHHLVEDITREIHDINSLFCSRVIRLPSQPVSVMTMLTPLCHHHKSEEFSIFSPYSRFSHSLNLHFCCSFWETADVFEFIHE